MELTIFIIIGAIIYLFLGRVIINILDDKDIIDVYDDSLKVLATIFFPLVTIYSLTIWAADKLTNS